MKFVTTVSLPIEMAKDWQSIPAQTRSKVVTGLLQEYFSGIEPAKDTKSYLLNKQINKSEVKQDKRNPEVQGIIDTWLEYVGQPDGTQAEQRRFAKLLINKHGYERSIGAVKAVTPSRSLRFNPSITSIKDLYYKFGKLEDAYQREKKTQDDPEREPTQEELDAKWAKELQ